jgi:hypothetical protein
VRPGGNGQIFVDDGFFEEVDVTFFSHRFEVWVCHAVFYDLIAS